jgi:MscS family membrane protein
MYFLLETPRIHPGLLITVVALTGILIILGSFLIPRLIGFLIARLFSDQAKEAYQKIVMPNQSWLGVIIILTLVDLTVLLVPTPVWLEFVEIPLGLSVVILMIWLGSRLFSQFFDIYLLDIALKSKRKINSELLIIAKFLANAIIFLILIFLFAETHQINLIGLITSVGIGGLAIAFASQKILEQLLGGVVLFLDRPFVVDDYIGLSDGTFGRVETIGWRSTKIRTSGKGTLMIIPNNALTQINIENFTGAKKVISLIYLTFYCTIPQEEKALIRQIIVESTKDIFGIDPRNTEVTFKDKIDNKEQSVTQAQVNLFILGSEDVSMDLRRQLLDIAQQNITQQMKDYGIAFDIEEQQTVNIDSPITI